MDNLHLFEQYIFTSYIPPVLEAASWDGIRQLSKEVMITGRGVLGQGMLSEWLAPKLIVAIQDAKRLSQAELQRAMAELGLGTILSHKRMVTASA